MAVTREHLEEAGLIAIIRADIEADLVQVAQALVEGGIRAMEITLNTPGALTGIAQVRHTLGGRLHVGAGTILSARDAQAALDAGAEFIVTPTLQPETIALCRGQAAPIACGCMTPTEAFTAHQAGADFIKLFPADTLGPAFIRALLAPLPFLRIIPTGGVSTETVADYIAAGSVAVAVGSSLVSGQILRDQAWAALTERARRLVGALSDARMKSAKGSPP